jgi:UDP-N-acetylmuramate dehydrogenase
MTDGTDRIELATLADRLGPSAARNVPLGPMTTYRVGGSAALLVRAGSVADLRHISAALDGLAVPAVVVGKGSNLLVSDSGFEGLVVILGGSCDEIDVPSPSGEVNRSALATFGGSVALPVAARRSVAAGLTGFEWAVGVPGSVGGAVRMNAGGHGSDMAASLERVHLYHLRRGLDRPVSAEALGLRFRGSALGDDHVVLSATVRLEWAADASAGQATIDEIVRWRRDHQPGGHNAGSVFVNPEPGRVSAGELIDGLGLRGLRIGTAEVSTKHANFIQADEGGRSADVVALMAEVRRRVEDAHGYRMRSEIRLLGFEQGADGDVDEMLADITDHGVATVRLEHVFDAIGSDGAVADPSLPFVAPDVAPVGAHVEPEQLGQEARADLLAAFVGGDDGEEEHRTKDIVGPSTKVLPSELRGEDDEDVLDDESLVEPLLVPPSKPGRSRVVIVDDDVEMGGSGELDAGARADRRAGTAHVAPTSERTVVITDASVADVVPADSPDDEGALHEADGSSADATRPSLVSRIRASLRRNRPLLTPRERLMRRRRRIFYGTLATVTFGAGALVVLSSPVVGVRYVDVEGNRYVDADRIARVVDSLLGVSVLTADTAEARRQLEEDPWVARVRITTYFPDRVVIEVEERVPAAWFAGVDGSARVIDVAGHVLAVVDGLPTDYARIEGTGPNLVPGATADPPFRAAVQLSQSLPPEIAPLVASFGVTETGQITMTLTTGTIVSFGEPVDMRNKLVSLVVLLRRQDPNDLQTVDLSSGDPVVQTR